MLIKALSASSAARSDLSAESLPRLGFEDSAGSIAETVADGAMVCSSPAPHALQIRELFLEIVTEVNGPFTEGKQAVSRAAAIRRRGACKYGVVRLRRLLPADAGARQHGRKRLEDLAHLRRLVRKHLGRIHVVDDSRVVGLKDQEFAVAVFRTVDCEIIETDAARDRIQCAAVATRKVAIEIAHETFFFAALLSTERHARIEIPDVPALGDRHMTGKGLSADEHDPVFAEQAVAA